MQMFGMQKTLLETRDQEDRKEKSLPQVYQKINKEIIEH